MVIIKGIEVILLALLPSLIWLFIFLRRARHPEPRRLLVMVFLWGFIITPFVGLFEQCVNNPLGAALNIVLTPAAPYCQSLMVPALLDLVQNSILGWLIFFLLSALIEEFAKFFVVRASVVNSPEFDEPVDVMVYLIVAALGFAASENVFAALNVASSQGMLTDPTILSISGSVASILILRFLGATLLHTLASGMLGYYLAKGYFLIPRHSRPPVHHVLIKGLLLATLVHGAFNLFINLSNGLTDLNYVLAILGLLAVGAMAVFIDLDKLNKTIFVIR